MVGALVLIYIDFIILVGFGCWVLYGWILSKVRERDKIKTTGEVIIIPDPKVLLVEFEENKSVDIETCTPIEYVSVSSRDDEKETEQPPGTDSDEEEKVCKPPGINEAITPRLDSSKKISVEQIEKEMYLIETPLEAPLIEDVEEETTDPCLCVGVYGHQMSNELTVCLSTAKNIFISENESVCISIIVLATQELRYTSNGKPPDPIFNNEFVLNISEKDLKDLQIKFNVWRIDEVSRKVPFGEALLTIGEYIDEGNDSKNLSNSETWLDIVKKDRLVGNQQESVNLRLGEFRRPLGPLGPADLRKSLRDLRFAELMLKVLRNPRSTE